MSKWKHFSDEETANCVDELCIRMDYARELFGFPIVATCWYRDPVHNAEIGGVPDSAHTKGMAVDIRVPADTFMREKLIWALGAAGFKRFEDAPKHFHVDIDDTKPTPCFFPGDDH